MSVEIKMLFASLGLLQAIGLFVLKDIKEDVKELREWVFKCPNCKG